MDIQKKKVKGRPEPEHYSRERNSSPHWLEKSMTYEP